MCTTTRNISDDPIATAVYRGNGYIMVGCSYIVITYHVAAIIDCNITLRDRPLGPGKDALT